MTCFCTFFSCFCPLFWRFWGYKRNKKERGTWFFFPFFTRCRRCFACKKSAWLIRPITSRLRPERASLPDERDGPYNCRSRPFLRFPRPSLKQIAWGQVRVYSLFYLQFSSRCSGLHLPPQALVLFLFAALSFCFLFIFFSFIIILL